MNRTFTVSTPMWHGEFVIAQKPKISPPMCSIKQSQISENSNGAVPLSQPGCTGSPQTRFRIRLDERCASQTSKQSQLLKTRRWLISKKWNVTLVSSEPLKHSRRINVA